MIGRPVGLLRFDDEATCSSLCTLGRSFMQGSALTYAALCNVVK